MYKSKAWLYKRFVVEGKTVDAIAKEAKCSRRTIYNYLEKFGLKGIVK
jgi:transposase